jgi:hypothetical protein
MLLSIWFVGSACAQQQPLVDVFPIRLGMQYSYAHQAESISNDEIYTSGTRDSGLVEYVVFDSTAVSDSAIVWWAKEILSLRRRLYNSLLMDSTFWVYDTLAVQLQEQTYGKHELSCPGRIWSFPPGVMYRYQDSSFHVIYREWDSLFVRGGDTLWLQNTSGLYKRRARSFEQRGYMHINRTLEADLLNVPLSVRNTGIKRPTIAFLKQNYPNPFNSETIIEYELQGRSQILLRLYNILGELIAIVEEGERDAGLHSIRLSADRLPSGIFFYELRADRFWSVMKLAVTK